LLRVGKLSGSPSPDHYTFPFPRNRRAQWPSSRQIAFHRGLVQTPKKWRAQTDSENIIILCGEKHKDRDYYILARDLKRGLGFLRGWFVCGSTLNEGEREMAEIAARWLYPTVLDGVLFQNSADT